MTHTTVAAVAQRVKELRKRTGLSAARLAEEMTKAGIPWKREIVANLENGRRDRLDVDELLALAAVFQVPPVALLIDATSETTAVAPNLELPTAHVLLWMIGEQPLQGMAGTWMDETIPVRLVRRLHEAVLRCRNARVMLDSIDHHAATGKFAADDATDRRRVEERQLTHGLHELSQTIAEMRGYGMAVPVLAGQAQLEADAQARGFTLGDRTYDDGVVYVTEED